MGTYAITVDDYNVKLNDIDLYKGLAITVNNTGQNYIHEELALNAYDNSRTLSSSIVIWDEYESKYVYYWSQGGGASYLLNLNSDNKWIDSGAVNSSYAFASGYPDYFIRTKSNKIYGVGGGIGSYDEDWNPTLPRYPFANVNLAYDTKRNYLITSGINPYLGGGGSYLTRLDLNKEPITLGLTDIIYPVMLHEITASNIQKPFSIHYSSYDDMYYYVFAGSIYKTNPETGVREVVLTKGVDIIALIITEGSNEGYYAYVENAVSEAVVVGRFDLDNPSVVKAEYNIGNVSSFYFVYVGKFVVFAAKDNVVPSSGYGIWQYITVLSSDLVYNLSRKKYMGVPTTNVSGEFILTDPTFLAYSTFGPSNTYNKVIAANNHPQKFKPLSGDEINVHIPVAVYPTNAGVPTGSTTFILNIKPIVPYPTVTSPTELDCCLDELICDINTKLASTSCKATNMAIVGRHYGGMTNDAELLESLLWITTFDCLTCDEIEKLRCITSKI
tara:strand:+ start:334 stop:1833 length:1500 start_codon:yes stop_codon:yes gene_type:complete